MNGERRSGTLVLRGTSPNTGGEERHHGGDKSFIYRDWFGGADLDAIDSPYSFPAKTQGSEVMLLEFWLPPEPVDMAGP